MDGAERTLPDWWEAIQRAALLCGVGLPQGATTKLERSGVVAPFFPLRVSVLYGSRPATQLRADEPIRVAPRKALPVIYGALRGRPRALAKAYKTLLAEGRKYPATPSFGAFTFCFSAPSFDARVRRTERL